MTRLLVEISIEAKLKLPHVDFAKIRLWYSEGLLSSPFLARKRKDDLTEGYTHADMALGDLRVDSIGLPDYQPLAIVGNEARTPGLRPTARRDT